MKARARTMRRTLRSIDEIAGELRIHRNTADRWTADVLPELGVRLQSRGGCGRARLVVAREGRA